MPSQWTNALNWINPDVPGGKISPYCPDILLAHTQDPDAKSRRNSTNHLGVSKQILKAITMLPSQLYSAGIISPTAPQSDLELQVEIKSESSSRTHILTLAAGNDSSGNKKATLYHTCRGLSDGHPCYHMIMGLIVYNLYANQGSEFHKLFRDNVTKTWRPVDLLRAGDELYFDIKEGKIPRDIDLVGEIARRPYATDLMQFIIHGSSVANSHTVQQISIDMDKLLKVMDNAANTALKF
ncbi:MAG: hypothetical protein OI715_00575 (plasmid) [Candidatus Methanoperedens sp.]|nr:MAG: hypothetical protein OI715_00575 [Candidatus Methanoperedens sp.]